MSPSTPNRLFSHEASGLEADHRHLDRTAGVRSPLPDTLLIAVHEQLCRNSNPARSTALQRGRAEHGGSYEVAGRITIETVLCCPPPAGRSTQTPAAVDYRPWPEHGGRGMVDGVEPDHAAPCSPCRLTRPGAGHRRTPPPARRRPSRPTGGGTSGADRVAEGSGQVDRGAAAAGRG
jgi:hypothetical protein